MEGTYRFYNTYCITKDCLPINVIKGACFKKMIYAFDSRYKISSRNHFSRIELPVLCASVKQPVKQDIMQHYFQLPLICGLAWLCNPL